MNKKKHLRRWTLWVHKQTGAYFYYGTTPTLGGGKTTFYYGTTPTLGGGKTTINDFEKVDVVEERPKPRKKKK